MMTDDDRVDQRIREGLQREYDASEFPKDELRDRMAATLRARRQPLREGSKTSAILGHPAVRAGLAVAAALVVFVAGAEYGRRAAVHEAAGPTAVDSGSAISIQRAGSAYVSHLARFAAEAPGLSRAEREEARQVATAILYAATVELLREAEDDDLLAAVAQLIHSRRQSQRYPQHDGRLWF